MLDDIKAYERKVYDRWGEGYDQSIWVRWMRAWVKGYEKDVPEGSSILDIGCGTANALAILLERKPAFLAGLDLSEGVLNVARRKMQGQATDLRAGDAEDLPWEENTFDVALMTAALHHFPNPDTALREAWRVVKPRGRLIVAEPHFIFPFLQVFNLLLRVYPLNGDLGFFSQQGLKELVERCGFEQVVQKRAAFMARYTLCFKRETPERTCAGIDPKARGQDTRPNDEERGHVAVPKSRVLGVLLVIGQLWRQALCSRMCLANRPASSSLLSPLIGPKR